MYNIKVLNGSFLHKKMVESYEKTSIVRNIKEIDGIEIAEPYITIDLKKIHIPKEYQLLQDLFFRDNSCVLVI